MPILICVSILTEDRPGRPEKYLGKRKLVECGLRMSQKDQFTFSCPNGHERHYPDQKWHHKYQFINPSLKISPLS